MKRQVVPWPSRTESFQASRSPTPTPQRQIERTRARKTKHSSATNCEVKLMTQRCIYPRRTAKIQMPCNRTGTRQNLCERTSSTIRQIPAVRSQIAKLRHPSVQMTVEIMHCPDWSIRKQTWPIRVERCDELTMRYLFEPKLARTKRSR